jgi:acyl-coenzyme A thioesterase PaaI-like protein
MSELSLQDRFMPEGICFGCGPANEKGLRIKSFPDGDVLVAQWSAEPHHAAFPGVLNGGIIGALLDCHANWTACWSLMLRDGDEAPPCTVTADYAIKLIRPTPMDKPIMLTARLIDSEGPRATIEGELSSGGKVCASCIGNFVAVPPGHPGHYRTQ